MTRLGGYFGKVVLKVWIYKTIIGQSWKITTIKRAREGLEDHQKNYYLKEQNMEVLSKVLNN